MLKGRPDISENQEEQVLMLFGQVQECVKCTRMTGCKRVLSSANGDVSAKIMFVAEAPGRFGAERYGIPLFGDRTGKNFDSLLQKAGFMRANVFITNAVLCNPRAQDGLNDRPTFEEINSCNAWLRQTIQTILPEVVVALGQVALNALSLIEEHELVLRKDVGRPTRWFGRYLIPFYHMSPRALMHRNMEKQAMDYKRLRKFATSIGGV
ncbi:MAG: uracil-DNA glycosylase [Thermodesulfobacteriota bacterium]